MKILTVSKGYSAQTAQIDPTQDKTGVKLNQTRQQPDYNLDFNS